MAEHKSLSAAMAKAFAEIESATKSAANPHFKSKYADLTSVIEAIKPALVNNGLFFTQVPVPHEKGVHIETWLHHESGNSMLMGGLFVPADRNNAQAFGSALTYARRYALVTAFGVPVEDDDGNAAAKAPPAKVELISDADWALLTQLIEATGTDTAKLCKAYKVDNLKAMTATNAADAIAVLQKRLEGMAKEATDAAGK
jgi:hypothetical protein